jgi:hypothetical protein
MQPQDSDRVVKCVIKLVGLARLYHYTRKTEKLKVTDTAGQIKSVIEIRQMILNACK